MAKWLEPRGRKESRPCECCKEYRMGGQFYDWHSHPALSSTHVREPIIICTKCAKREGATK